MIQQQSIGERIADDFSENKCQLFDDEKRRLAAMIDAELAVMLAACKAWSDFFAMLDKQDNGPDSDLSKMRNKYHATRLNLTRAAIAKAEGRAESSHPVAAEEARTA